MDNVTVEEIMDGLMKVARVFAETPVTERDIRCGEKQSVDKCPIARALERIEGLHSVKVVAGNISAKFEQSDDAYLNFKTTPALERWIGEYDTDIPVPPIDVRLQALGIGFREAVIVEQEATS